MDLTRYLAGIAFLIGSMAVGLIGAHLAYARVFNRHVPPIEPPEVQPADVSSPAAQSASADCNVRT